jgi:hypothetical protein
LTLNIFKRKQREDKRVILRHAGIYGLRIELYTHEDHVDIIKECNCQEQEEHDASSETIEHLTDFFTSKGYYLVNSWGLDLDIFTPEIERELQ